MCIVCIVCGWRVVGEGGGGDSSDHRLGPGITQVLATPLQSGPLVYNIMLCGHFAASFTCEITGNGDKLISNQM